MSHPSGTTATTQRSGGGGDILMGILIGGFTLLIAFPASMIALWARRHVKAKQGFIVLLAGLGIGGTVLLARPIKAHMKDTRTALTRAKGVSGFVHNAASTLPLWWLYTLPLAPALTLIWESVRPKSLEEQQREKQEQQIEQAHIKLDTAQRRAAKARITSGTPKTLPDGLNTAAVLGARISGELPFFANHHQHLLYLNTAIGASSLHMLFAGENGSGKTAGMFRVAASIGAMTDWDLVFINPKNDQQTMQQWYDLMSRLGRRCRLFPQEAYNGWSGDSGALLSRIMAIPAYATEGAASYYSDMSEVYLRAVLNTGEPMPGSFEELEARLDYTRLAAQYKHNAEGHARVASISALDAKGVFMRFAMMTPKLTMIRRDGWNLEETRAAYFGLPVMANERDSQSVAKFLLEDIKHYLSVRKDPTRRTVFFIDEFSSLGTESVIRLAEMARSLGGIIMLGTQTLAGLGDADQQTRIVGNMSVVLYRMSDPDELTKLAGVQQTMVKTTHYEGRRMLKRGTYRMDDVARIDPQDVRTLPTGCAWIIARGAAAKVQMALMPDVPVAPIVIQKPRRQRVTAAPMGVPTILQQPPPVDTTPASPGTASAPPPTDGPMDPTTEMVDSTPDSVLPTESDPDPPDAAGGVDHDLPPTTGDTHGPPTPRF